MCIWKYRPEFKVLHYVSLLEASKSIHGCIFCYCLMFYFSHRFSVERKGIVKLFFYFDLSTGLRFVTFKNLDIVKWGQIHVVFLCVWLFEVSWDLSCPFKLLLLQLLLLLLMLRHHWLVKAPVAPLHSGTDLCVYIDCSSTTQSPTVSVRSCKHFGNLKVFRLHPKLCPNNHTAPLHTHFALK